MTGLRYEGSEDVSQCLSDERMNSSLSLYMVERLCVGLLIPVETSRETP